MMQKLSVREALLQSVNWDGEKKETVEAGLDRMVLDVMLQAARGNVTKAERGLIDPRTAMMRANTITKVIKLMFSKEDIAVIMEEWKQKGGSDYTASSSLSEAGRIDRNGRDEVTIRAAFAPTP